MLLDGDRTGRVVFGWRYIHPYRGAWCLLLVLRRVDSGTKIDKIAHVAGSPYVEDSGSHFNDESTRAEGIPVLGQI